MAFYAVLDQNYSNLNLGKLFSSLIDSDAAYHLWFIKLVIVLYLIFPLINKPLKGTKAIYFLALSLLVQVIWIFKGSVLTNWQIIFSHIFYFCLGIYFSNHEVFRWVKRSGAIIQSLLIVILASLLGYFWIKGSLIYGFFYSIPYDYSLKALYISLFLYSQILITLFYLKEQIFQGFGNF